MKHKSIDLAAEVKRATLPDGLHGFLFPLFEAVSNSLHSIEERWGNAVDQKGRIEIEISSVNREIVIADNGTGFDEKNLSAFLTPSRGTNMNGEARGSAASSHSRISGKYFIRLAISIGTVQRPAAATDTNRLEATTI